jgi:hypothetical protein
MITCVKELLGGFQMKDDRLCKTQGCHKLALKSEFAWVVVCDDFVDPNLCFDCNTSAGKIAPFAQTTVKKR